MAETLSNFLERFHGFVESLNGIVWGAPFLVLLIGTGVFLTFYLRFVQIRKLRHSVAVISGKYDDPREEGDLSHFQALSSALSATIGIGNIAGVATAIHYGGPGALFWMWVTAFVGMATKGVECYLGHRHRIINADGSASGGPMYYIANGMGENWKWLGVTFAFLAAFASLGSADMVQSNTVSQILKKDLSIPTYVSGLVMAVLVGLVIIGGIRRIGHVAAKLVPTMGAIYMIGGLVVIVLNINQLPDALALIFTKAFTTQGEVGGFAGSAFLLTLTWGAKRGLFSNEAGQGSAPIAHAAAKTSESVREGIVAQIGPLIDTIVVCSVTGIVIVSTGAWHNGLDADGDLLNGAALTAWAFKEGLSPIFDKGHYLVTLAVPLFAYSTMISWSYYGDRCVSFLWGRTAIGPYRIVFVIFTFIGATLSLPLVWAMADVSNGLMAAPNLIAILFLSRMAKKEYKEYFHRMDKAPSARP
ncbi:MAG: sodium:alanine symporter family protein [Candidatus Krumholzibacteria bacterium]|nr:sodium:alanine symporter family protein [Candidatus Krumholzibacteria bacterium]